jgi:uncharacterized integral membrane protein
VRLRRRVDTGQLAENWQPKLWLRLIVLGLLVAYVIAFVLENRKGVHVHFVLITASVSLIWVILLSLALGLLAGMLAAQLDRRRRRRTRQ